MSTTALRSLPRVSVVSLGGSLPVLLVASVAIALQVKGGGDESKRDRPTCLSQIKIRQSDPDFRFSKNNATFFRLSDGILYNGTGCNEDSCTTSDDMTLTLRGCQEFCGATEYHWPVGSLLAWFIPLILLLSNIALPPGDETRLMTIFH